MSTSISSLLWWSAIGLLFFWLMRRGGCGMGHGHAHGGHGDSEHAGHDTTRPSGKPIDPVCGMEVEPAKAAGTRLVDGATYFMCSQNCLDAFDKDPAMYGHHHDRHAGQPHAA